MPSTHGPAWLPIKPPGGGAWKGYVEFPVVNLWDSALIAGELAWVTTLGVEGILGVWIPQPWGTVATERLSMRSRVLGAVRTTRIEPMGTGRVTVWGPVTNLRLSEFSGTIVPGDRLYPESRDPRLVSKNGATYASSIAIAGWNSTRSVAVVSGFIGIGHQQGRPA